MFKFTQCFCEGVRAGFLLRGGSAWGTPGRTPWGGAGLLGSSKRRKSRGGRPPPPAAASTCLSEYSGRHLLLLLGEGKRKEDPRRLGSKTETQEARPEAEVLQLPPTHPHPNLRPPGIHADSVSGPQPPLRPG